MSWYAVLSLFSWGALLTAALWSGAQWHKHMAPDSMSLNNAGELLVAAQERVFVFRPDGSYKTDIDRSTAGIQQANTFGLFEQDKATHMLLGNAHFVLQRGMGLSRGRVLHHSESGHPPSTLAEPEDAVSMVVFNGELLVADAGKMAVWRYGADGQFLGELRSDKLQAWLLQLQMNGRIFLHLEKWCWRLFALLSVVVFILSLAETHRANQRQQREVLSQARVTESAIVQQGSSERPAVDDPSIHWLAKDMHRYRCVRYLVMLVMIFPLLTSVMSAITLFTQRGVTETGVTQWGVFLPVLKTGFLFLMSIGLLDIFYQRPRIGVLREWVILGNVRGHAAVGRGREILLFPNAIAIGDVAVMIGSRSSGELPVRSLLFEHAELQSWLAPRVLDAREKNLVDLWWLIAKSWLKGWT